MDYSLKPLLKAAYLLCLFSLFVAGCSRTAPVADHACASDYALSENWLNLPVNPDKGADVFYIYPVCWLRSDGEPPICPIDHPEMRTTARIVLQLQASLFDTVANIYAPYYRQLDGATILNEPDFAVRSRTLDREPAIDIAAAFDYYIKHYNRRKPFILAGHSEGAMLVKKLLFGYLKNNPDIYERMIAAYVIGYSITDREIAENPHVRFAQRADDVGVVISYNTAAPGMTAPNLTAENGALVINPISWTTTETTAAADQNLGAYLYIDGSYTTLPHLADATLNKQRGTLVCSTVNPTDYISAYGFFPEGNYHSFDFAFYYYNLRANAATRTTKWGIIHN